ncbi:TPA: O100 family O-antigen polymerase [Escherichia coli]|nr:O100 family O-antigen polymerase [Escherichia coli]
MAFIRFVNFLIIFFISIDMGGELGIRNVSFLLLVLLIAYYIVTCKKIKFRLPYVLLIILFLGYPVASLFIGMSNNFDADTGISQISIFVFAFLYFLKRIIEEDNNLPLMPIQYFNNAMLIISLFYVLMLISYQFFPSIFNSIALYIHDRGAGFAGVRTENGVGFANIYLKSSLFLIFTYCCFLKRNTIKAAIIILATVITTSKALLLTEVLLLVTKLKGRLISVVVFVSALLLFIAIYFDEIMVVFNYMNETLQGNSETYLVRVHHFEDLVALFLENPINFLFGFGAGSSFFSSYYGKYIFNIELDHLNAIRKFGLIWFLSFMWLVFFNIIQLVRLKRNELALGLFLSFVLAGTNPVLLSPIFFILLIECHLLTLKVPCSTSGLHNSKV